VAAVNDSTEVSYNESRWLGLYRLAQQVEPVIAPQPPPANHTQNATMIVPMDRYRFPEGEEPEVLTSISIECQYDQCERCPGIFHVAEHGGEPVFCVHECHLVPSEA